MNQTPTARKKVDCRGLIHQAHLQDFIASGARQSHLMNKKLPVPSFSDKIIINL
jgi:hypothetical protein